MIRGLIAVASAFAAFAGPARAADPVREFPISTIEALGQAIHRQDSAAWVATDALMAKVGDPGAASLVGWIVVDSGVNQKVRFLRRHDGRLEVGYDIEVSPDLTTVVSEPAERALTDEETAMFAARQTAIAGMKGLTVCRPGYNTAVVKDPERAGWIVWLLAPVPEAGALPLGGHYRFSISADGRKVTRRDALSAGCMVMPKPDSSTGEVAAAVVTHVVSPTPVETHVFLQMQSRKPLYVAAGEHIWSIAAGRITDQGALSARRR